MSRTPTACRWLVALAGAALVLPSLGAAQAPVRRQFASIFGQVLHDRSRKPITGARILVGNEVVIDSTDAEGRFDYGGIIPGTHAVQVLATGYEPVTFVIDVEARERAEFVIELRTGAYVLPALTVKGKGAATEARVYKGRLSEFERRKDAGRGFFIDRKKIEESHAMRVGDILKEVRGVKVRCDINCRIRMTRSQECAPAYFLDGLKADEIDAINLPVLDVGGIEVYRGPSETPGEFLSSDAMCGVVAVWTYSGPRRDQEPPREH